MFYFRRMTAWLALASLCALPLLAQPVSDTVQQQIQAVLTVKSTFNAAEQKMSSNLAFAARLQRGDLPASLVNIVQPLIDPNGDVQLDIRAVVSPRVLSRVISSGGRVIHSLPQHGHMRVQMPLFAVEALAADRDVIAIEQPAGYRTNAGALTSQGYVSHMAQQVVNNVGFTGNGVKVGVLSDSASAARVAALIATGDLPANTTVLTGQAGSGTDEGAAMMEIVHDMAPDAQLYFATADPSAAQFAANILALQAAGCSIIVDDVTYFNEGAFQDGPIAQAVNTVTGLGVLYISSAGNSGNLTDATSGTWEGDFLNGGPVNGTLLSAGETGTFHNFGSVGSPQTWDILSAQPGPVSLKWSDQLGASANDYDLFIVNAAGNSLKAFSAASQTGTQDPYEIIGTGSGCGGATPSGYCWTSGDRVMVVLFSGAARALRVDTNRGRLSIATAGATVGHNAGANTLTAAATYWNSAKTGTKPFTGAANPVELFNSDGPRKIFYNPNGAPISPGNFLFGTNGGLTLQKPELTAADGVSAKTPGFNPFFGTSAAAPHLAGIAALVKSAKPNIGPQLLRQIMITTALDNMAAGADRDGGYGVAMALAAVNAALALP